MPRNPFQRLVSLAGPSSAVSRISRASASDAAPQDSKMPQSQPMQRSTESQLSDLETPGTASSPDYEQPLPSDSPATLESKLHSPLHPNHPALLRIAEQLCQSIATFDNGERFTPSPSPDEYYTCSHDLTDEECTVLAVHWLVKKAALPVDTFILASLILRQLKSDFYDEWCETLPVYPPHYEEERTKEVVIMAAIIIAQKFLHDAIYTLTTWSEIVCEYRPDLHNHNLHFTERLILSHIKWRVWMIADEDTVSEWVADAHSQANATYERYFKYMPSDSEDGDDGDETHGGASPLNGF